jgi:hypothetical protein
MKKQHTDVVNALKTILPDSDIIHFDDTKRNIGVNGANGRSLDVRAISELVDVQTLSGLKQMAIFMNRNQGITESWGTVQFKIYCSGLDSCKRGSKRLIEEVARLWLRVNGIQAVPVFKHNILDWQSEEQRMNVNLLKQQFYAIARMMGWIDNDTAAREVMKVEKAFGEPAENVRVSLSSGGGNGDVRNDKHSGAKPRAKGRGNGDDSEDD